MNRYLCFIVTFTTLLFSNGVTAQCSLSEVASAKQSYEEYVVSGVLQMDGKPDVIKLTHSVVKAKNADEALGKFQSMSQVKFPGYGLATSLVSLRGLLLTYEPCNFDI